MSEAPTTADGKLGLTPQERRLVAGVGLVVFAVLNIWLVWPHFGDWKKIQAEREKAERTLGRYQTEIKRLPAYQTRLHELENLGSSIVAEEQDVDLATTVQVQSQISKLEITRNNDVRSSNTQTNQFFDEKARTITYRGETDSLVQFLTSLTTTNSLIRVRDMTIKPEPPNNPNKLSGDITLVASYQRKAPLKPAAPAVTNAPAKKIEPAAKNAASAPPAKKPSASNIATNKPATAKPNTSTPTKPKS